MAHIESIQVGLPQDLGDPASDDPRRGVWRSAFYKLPVAGPVRVEAEMIAGDGVADRTNHGGPNKAILGYAAGHYAGWRTLLGSDARAGGFGENLTISGQTEREVCVGDVYEIGTGGVVLEVSQPRQPCWKLGRRWNRPEMPALVIETGHTGWYFRVRAIGQITPGDAVRQVDRPYATLTVAGLNDMLYGRRPVTAEAIDCPALAAGWRRQLRQRWERSS